MYKLLDIRLNQRPEDVVDYLKAIFTDIKFSADIVEEEYGNGTRHRHYIYTDVELNDEKAKEVYQKLKLTSMHFIDRKNQVYN